MDALTPARARPPDAGALRVCVVCLGDICRSPTAAAVLRHLVRARGLQGRVVVESAGTEGWHEGGPAEPRTAAELRRRGVHAEHRARQFRAADVARFDIVLAMDRDDLDALRRLAPGDAARAKITALRGFDHGGRAGRVPARPRMVERACVGLLDHLAATGRP